jgi:iron complex outermembrane receptor protein
MNIKSKLTKLNLAISLAVPSISAFAQSEKSGFVLEEITVTAQRKEEGLQDTPIAVTAFSSEGLKDVGAVNVKDLTDFVPTLDVTRTSQNAMQVTLRGVTSTNNTELGDPAVSFNVDGIYTARPQAASALMFDTERVEVLRGPQGTLFGRNSPAGAINLITKKPHTDEVEGSIGVVVGDYNRVGVQGVLNLPVSDTFALRASFMDEQRDGFLEAGEGSLEPIADDETAETVDDTAFRIGANWMISDTVNWQLTYDYMDSASLPTISVLGTAEDARVADLRTASSTDMEMTALRSRLDWDLSDSVLLTYLASVNTLDRDQVASGVVGQNTTITYSENDSSTHEFQLTSIDAEKLDWIVGVFYFEEETYIDFLVDVNPTFGQRFLQPKRTSESRAVFGQATYHFNADLGLTVGARYSEDEKEDIGGGNYTCAGGIYPVSNCVQNRDNTRDDEWSAPTFRTQLDWNMNDETMFYTSVASGYKAGGFAAGGTPSYDEETLITYEVGSKNDLLDGRLRLNAALYISDYQDMQISSLEELDGGTIRATRNAASATIKGLEVEYTWVITDYSRLQGYVAYLDASFDDFPNAVDAIFDTTALVDASGNKLQNSPEWSFNISYDHDINLSSGATLRPRLAVSWRDDYYLRPINRPLDDEQDAATTVDASLRYTAANENWSAEIFGKNLTDEEVRVEAGGRANGSGVLLYNYRAPATYGVRVDYMF